MTVDLINRKLKELKDNFPKNPEFRTWMQQSDMWSWIYSVMTIRGEKVHKTAVVNLIEGRLVEDLPLSSYTFAQKWQDVYRDQINYIGMQTTLTTDMVCRWAKMLILDDPNADTSDVIRKNHMVVYEWELIPVEESGVLSALTDAVKNYVQTSADPQDTIKRAAKLHLAINKSYAFGEDTTLVSMAVLMFCLLECGYPLPCFSVDDREYNSIMADYVASGKTDAFVGMLARCLYNRTEAAASLAKQAMEEENKG